MAISASQCALQSSWRRAGTNARTVRGRHGDILHDVHKVYKLIPDATGTLSSLGFAAPSTTGTILRDFFALSPALATLSLFNIQLTY
jgi:hypothetical protein